MRARWIAATAAALALGATAASLDDGQGRERDLGDLAAKHGGVRVEVDRPVEVIPLYQRDPRIHGLTPLQALVDATPTGGVLVPPPGKSAGPVVLTRPMTIDGRGAVVVDAGGRGTVFHLRTDGATLVALRLTGSGESHDSDDACLNVRGDRNRIERLSIDDCLFGIDLKQASGNTVTGNRIRSKALPLGLRGDGLRLWTSHDNRIEGNEVTESRDVVAWYSKRNVFRGNLGSGSRYSIHFMFSDDNLVEGNRFVGNTVGVYLMYTERTHVRRNVISHANGPAGMGIGFKETSDTDIEGNELVYCAVGVGSDLSPFQPDTTIRFTGNRFAYNGVGLLFTSELGGNVLTDNVFEGNVTHVAYAGGAPAAERNRWSDNTWDDYHGFDRDGDGRGDTPHELYAYADRLWMEVPHAMFFRNAPALELLDFLERLAPFASPRLLLRDGTPRVRRPAPPPHG